MLGAGSLGIRFAPLGLSLRLAAWVYANPLLPRSGSSMRLSLSWLLLFRFGSALRLVFPITGKRLTTMASADFCLVHLTLPLGELIEIP
jgi:hypothetical protein